MTVQTFSPEGMFQPVPYHHVSVATETWWYGTGWNMPSGLKVCTVMGHLSR